MAPPVQSASQESEPGCWQKTHCDTCPGLCHGDAWWLYNCFCFPFVLVWNAINEYFLACLGVFAFRICAVVCCWPCKTFFPKIWYFKDKKFPPQSTSILDPSQDPFDDNEFYKATLAQVDQKLEWKRANDILKHGARRPPRTGTMQTSNENEDEPSHFFLFEGGIRPDDIVQGQLGDCWLLSALASMAEYPEAVRNIFVQNEHSPRHKYRVKMWNIKTKTWLHVSVDDYIPVKKGTYTPYFTDPQGLELWVFLVEKAFAKYHGGYAYLDGGRSPWAWHVLTGDNVFSFKLSPDGAHWATHIYEFEYRDSPKNQNHRMFLKDTGDRCNEERMFDLLRHYCHQRAPMGASIHSQQLATNGLVAFHAYSLIAAKKIKGKMLVKLRNPWGSGEWTGAWSDRDLNWDKNPAIRKACHQESDEFDGAFWMSMADFSRHFDRIDVCDRSAHRDLRLDVREDDGCCGVTKGCLYGCGSFWCCCQGIRTIYFGHRTSKELEYRKPVLPCARSDNARAWKDESFV